MTVKCRLSGCELQDQDATQGFTRVLLVEGGISYKKSWDKYRSNGVADEVVEVRCTVVKATKIGVIIYLVR